MQTDETVEDDGRDNRAWRGQGRGAAVCGGSPDEAQMLWDREDIPWNLRD
jgi:hypothetical protein